MRHPPRIDIVTHPDGRVHHVFYTPPEGEQTELLASDVVVRLSPSRFGHVDLTLPGIVTIQAEPDESREG